MTLAKEGSFLNVIDYFFLLLKILLKIVSFSFLNRV